MPQPSWLLLTALVLLAGQQAVSAVTCVVDPTQAVCAMYVYPNATADLDMLCVEMPGMPACAMSRACVAANSASTYCSSFTLLATGCADMGSAMPACGSYATLCRSGSVVPQCTTDAPVPGSLGYVSALTSALAVCTPTAYVGCSTCTTTNCVNPLATLTVVCSVSDQAGCSALQSFCGQPTVASAFPAFCTTEAGSTSGDVPPVKKYFHQRMREVVLWRHWIPVTITEYMCTFGAISMIGLMSIGLRTFSACMTAYFLDAALDPLPAQPGLVGRCMLKMGVWSEWALLKVGMAGHWTLPTGRLQLAENGVQGGIAALYTMMDVLAVLVAVIFNVIFLLGLVMGYASGVMSFAHMPANYANVLASRRSAREADEAAGEGKGEACAGEAVVIRVVGEEAEGKQPKVASESAQQELSLRGAHSSVPQVV